MGSGDLGGDPQPIDDEGRNCSPSALLIDEQLEVEDEAKVCAAIFWEASCLRRFIRLSSSLKLFDISPAASGVSRNTDVPETTDAFAAAAAADIRDDCGRNKPCLKCLIPVALEIHHECLLHFVEITFLYRLIKTL